MTDNTRTAGLRPRQYLGATRNIFSIDFMTQDIADWLANVARSKTAAEMRANVLRAYPGLGMEFTLNDRVAAYFPARPAGGTK